MRGIHIQRPVAVTDKQRMYGDAFHTTEAHPHAYECVQPLQGLITFVGEPEDGIYPRNNYSYDSQERPQEEAPSCPDWDYAIYGMLVVKFGMGAAMLWDIEKQTAYNDIALTNFKPLSDDSLYKVVGAGTTNPLYCLLIALCLVIFSVIVGLTSSKKYMFNVGASWGVNVVLFVLQATALALHILMLSKQNLSGYCLTTVSMIVLHAVTVILTLVGMGQMVMAPQSSARKKFMSRVTTTNGVFTIEPAAGEDVGTKQDFKDYTEHKDLTHEEIKRETTFNFWLCVVEDLNTIMCYAFVVRACDAQSSIHDDSTTFFDILCIVFLGFLQHVANILMIFHAHIEKQTEIQMRELPASTKLETKKAMNQEVVELVTFIARTRLLLFFMIGITVVFFYLRVSPTYEENPHAIPYEILRVLALVTMVSLNTLHSAWYEVQSAQNPKKTWNTSPTWKLGTLAFISLVFSLMLLINTTNGKDEDIRQRLHKLTTPAPSGATLS